MHFTTTENTMKIALMLIGLLCVVGLEVKYNLLSDMYNLGRPYAVADTGSKCLSKLKANKVTFKYLGKAGTKSCLIKNAVKVSKFSSITMNSAVTLNCNTALQLSNWLKEIKATSVTHMGSYNCRLIGGSRLLSEHSFGTAVDIASINGLSIRKNWDSVYLKKALHKACSYFSNVIGPDHNKAHADHFHLDNGYGFSCLF